MERSNNSQSRGLVVLLDRAVLAGLGVGLSLYVMPFWKEGRLAWAFWLTFACTLLHIYTSHRRSADESQGRADP